MAQLGWLKIGTKWLWIGAHTTALRIGSGGGGGPTSGGVFGTPVYRLGPTPAQMMADLAGGAVFCVVQRTSASPSITALTNCVSNSVGSDEVENSAISGLPIHSQFFYVYHTGLAPTVSISGNIVEYIYLPLADEIAAVATGFDAQDTGANGGSVTCNLTPTAASGNMCLALFHIVGPGGGTFGGSVNFASMTVLAAAQAAYKLSSGASISRTLTDIGVQVGAHLMGGWVQVHPHP